MITICDLCQKPIAGREDMLVLDRKPTLDEIKEWGDKYCSCATKFKEKNMKDFEDYMWKTLYEVTMEKYNDGRYKDKDVWRAFGIWCAARGLSPWEMV